VRRTRARAALDRLAYRRAPLVLATSDLLAGELRQCGIPRERVCVVPPGRDVPEAPRARPPDLRHGRRAAFLCVANWLPHKGITELLDAFAALPADAGTLHLVGDEHADRRYAQEVAHRLSAPALADRVVRHGPLPHDALLTLYTAADVFVLPAYREVYGMAWGEAMAFGLPVVGWRAGNHPELATDGREGLLAAPGDVRALARALASLAADEGIRRRLGDAAAARAGSRPTWEDSATAFFAAIRSVVAGAPRHRQPGSVGEHT
jgi:glycosyltransferase involved in cell wall biosynthesis